MHNVHRAGHDRYWEVYTSPSPYHHHHHHHRRERLTKQDKLLIAVGTVGILLIAASFLVLTK